MTVTNKTAIGKLGTGFSVDPVTGVISIASSGLDITGLTEETSFATGDMFPFYDVSASANRKGTLANMVAAMAATVTPFADGVAAVGTGVKFAKEDHVHPAVSGGLTWSVITTSQSGAVDNGYVCNATTLITVTLPTTIAVGKTIRVTGMGTGGWKIAQNAGQQIFFGDQNTTSGATGYISSIYYRDAVELVCIVANTTFQVVSAVGTMDVV